MMSYPATTAPWDDTQNCIVTAYNEAGESIESKESDCNKLEGSRLFKMDNAIPYGYDAKVVIKINLINPVDNWGTIGLKLKTFETFSVMGVTPDGKEELIPQEFLVDQLEGNELVPLLKCLAPCKECRGG